MTCPEFIDLLSSRIDGDLTPPQRVRLEAHLQACADCRRGAEQMERAVAWVRGLERLPAPPPPLRLAGLAQTRRSAWGALRPLALAASAVLAALLAWEGFEALVTPGPATSPALTTSTDEMAGARDSSNANPTLAAPSPTSAGPRVLPAPAAVPEPAGELDPRLAATLPAEPPASTPAPGPLRPSEPASQEPVYARLHGRQPSAEQEDQGAEPDDAGSVDSAPAPGGGVRSAPGEPVGPATTVWIVQPDAGAPTPSGATPPAGTTGRPAAPSHTGRAEAPSATESRPAATEVAISIPVVAWVDADAVRFGDPGEEPPGELDRAGDTDAGTERAPGADLVRRGAETPRPDADPRTGVTPPVPLERPRMALPSAPDPDAWRLLPPLSLQITIAADGRVVRVSPLPWPGPREVAEALAGAVRDWAFLPAELAGEAIATRLELTIEFDAR